MGNRIFTPNFCALFNNSFTVGIESISTKDLPIFLPCAARKVKTMPPPIAMIFTFSRKLEITPILSETFAPPKTTPYGRDGFLVNFSSTSTSAATKSPAAWGNIFANSYTDACLR